MTTKTAVTTEPQLIEIQEQSYMGLRVQIPSKDLSKWIPRLLKELNKWMEKHEVKRNDVPFLRFYVIDMAVEYDIEIGMPVAQTVAGDGRVNPGVIPSGKYASLIYTGKNRGYQGNKRLVEWARDNGIAWDRWDDPKGDAFRSRIEWYLTDPAEQPDTTKWETRVAIKLADD